MDCFTENLPDVHKVHFWATLDVGVAYSTTCVFHTPLEHPFNDWTDTHIAQGFTWRPGSVSFQTLENSGSCETTIQLRSEVVLRHDTVRAIQVPFSVPDNCTLTVGSVGDEHEIRMPAGDFCLVHKTGLKPYEPPEGEELDEWTATLTNMWCRFTFCPCEGCQAEILRQDELLSPPSPLFMESWPAL